MKRTLLLAVLALMTAMPVKAQWVIADREMLKQQQQAFCGFEKKYESQNWDKITMYLNFLTNFQYEISDRKHQDYIKEEIASVTKIRRRGHDDEKDLLEMIELRVKIWSLTCKANL